MSIYAVVFARAKAYTNLAGLVSDRIFPHQLPTGVQYPAVAVFLVSSPLIGGTHDTGGRGLSRSILQFSCWAKTPGVARNVAEQVLAAFDGWRDGTTSPRVDGALKDNQVSGYDPDTQLYQEIVDIAFLYGV